MIDTEQLEWWLRGFGDEVSDVQKEPLAQKTQKGRPEKVNEFVRFKTWIFEWPEWK